LGNYWSTYKGIDSDKDGIGDTALVVNDKNTDNYPLTKQVNNYTNLVNIDSIRQLMYQNVFPPIKGVPNENYLYTTIFAVTFSALLVSIIIIIIFRRKISKSIRGS
jgi:hypothetical protein